MSLDDYINRVPEVPPQVNLDEQQSSLDVDYPPLDPGRAHITNTSDQSRPGNSTVPRFSLDYWTAQHTEDAVATVVPASADRLTLTSEFRTNKDRSALLWSSKDELVHQLTSYVENVNYQNVVLAFQHNTDVPDEFTATIVNSAGTFLYRLVPYGFNDVTNKYECLDKKFSTGKTYPETVYDSTKTNIAGVPYAGRTDYIFILDFNDLRQGHNFSGGLIDPRKISSIALDVLPVHHALGVHAYVARIVDMGNGTAQMELGGVEDTAKLSAGDVITGLLTYINNSETQVTINTRWTVVSSTGFGSSARSVLVQGNMPGSFFDFPVMYCRDLAMPSVMEVTNKVHTFGNFHLSGTGVLTMGKRTYTQDPNSLSLVSNLDDDHKMQPKRLVESVKAMGYRQDWHLSLGSSAYFQGTTTLHKEGVSDVVDSQVHDWPVLYAGEAQLNGQYVVGRAPSRGIDKLHDDVTDSWNSQFAGIMAFNGTTKNSSAEKAGMPVGGSYWWDLDTDVPGPAALNAVAAMRGNIPKGMVWCLGDTDAVVIEDPGTRSPAPTIARAKEATEKLFAYFRSLWGATFPIWIQEQAWGWVGTDPVDPTDPETSVPIQRGAPTYLRVRRTAYGDLLFEWKSYALDPALATYRVEIYNPLKISEVLHSFVVPGAQEESGYVFADWSVEDNGPVRALVDSGNDYWAGIRWRVVSVSAMGQIPSVTKSGLVPIDNTLVERVIVCGPNLYTGNYFTKVSDPTHGFNRRDLQAATIMRKEYTDKLNMRRLKVMPLDVSDEDRGDEETDPEDMKYGLILKDWWDLVNGFPGPSLVAAIAKINALDRPVAHWAMGQPGETELFRTMDPVDIMVRVGELKLANAGMLTFLRTVLSAPNLKMWMQGATTTWMGVPGVIPTNINELGAQAMRSAQSQQCLASSDFFLGSYVPGRDNYQNFQSVGLERKYPTPSTYNATAKEMGESMALLIDRAVDDSGCPDMVLNVSPEYSLWGTGWSALYAAPGNGEYSAAGTVDIPNVRLAHMLFASTGPVVPAIEMAGVPNLSLDNVYICNGAVITPADLSNGISAYPAWGPVFVYSDSTEGILLYSDNSLVITLAPEDSAKLTPTLGCKVYDDTAGGVLVYDTTLYAAGGTAGYPTKFYFERLVIDAADVQADYPAIHPDTPPFNPATALIGHNLRFVLTSSAGVAPYFNATSIAVWGTPEEPISSIKLSKNGGADVTVVPTFVTMESTPAEYTGQWRVDLNEAILELEEGDTVGVTFMGVCDHDTGPGCDNPILITVEGIEFDVSARYVKVGTQWLMFFASQNNGSFVPVGNVSPMDLPVIFIMSNGITEEGGNTALPSTSFSFWGNATDGYTHVTFEQNNVKLSYPLTFTALPGGRGVWSYGQESAIYDMTSGNFKLTIHGGIAAAREVEICAYCVGCPIEDTMEKSMIEFGNSSNLYTYGWLRTAVEHESVSCVNGKQALDAFGTPLVNPDDATGHPVWYQGIVSDGQTMDLRNTQLSVGGAYPGGYGQRFSLTKPDGTVVDAGYIWYSESSSGIVRDEQLLIPVFTFGIEEGQYVNLLLYVNVIEGDTIYDTTLPALETITITDSECLLGNLKPVCCHFAYPDPEPEPEPFVFATELSASPAFGPMQVNGVQFDRPPAALDHFFDIPEGADILTTNPQDSSWSSNTNHYVLLQADDGGVKKPIEQVYPDWTIAVEEVFGCSLAGQVDTGVVTPLGPVALVSSGVNQGNGQATVTITDGHGVVLRTFTVNGRASSSQFPVLRSFKAGATMGGPINSMFTGSTLGVTGPRAYSASWQFQADPLNQFAVGSVNTRNSQGLTTAAQQEVVSPVGHKIWVSGAALDAADVSSFEARMICGIQVEGSPLSPTLVNIGVSEGECTPVHPGAGIPNHPVFATEDVGDLFAPWGTLEGAMGSVWEKDQTFSCEYGSTSAPGDIPG